ncbi:MAG TPA: hypothetical protein P5163_16325 [Rubrivivax sp.]|nr:hypothetical protein [Pseudomonadota bacterium]HOW46925.1 hypothetical protein [Rubrivivax sp.]HRY86736.1 hypothetical protein [Rubrivivax sp.]HRZ62155.1 hypothetical protein [Rubrivivax sp.]
MARTTHLPHRPAPRPAGTSSRRRTTGKRVIRAFAAAAAAAVAFAAAAQMSDLPDLIFQPQSQAAQQLPGRGFTLVRTQPAGRGGEWQFWWNASSAQCMRVAVNNGQITQIIGVDAGDCGQGGGGSSGGSGSGWRPNDRDPGDLVGRDAGSASREMSRRGYVLSRSESARGGGFWQFWWHARLALCQRVAVNGDRVTQVIETGAGDCGQGGHGGGNRPSNERDPSDLVFRDADSAARELTRRGYALSRSESARGGGFWQFWWHARLALCQRVAVNNNQVTQIIETGAGDCGQGGGSGGSTGPWGGRDPSDLVGRDAGFASRELNNRGYVLSGSESARGGGFWQFWWHPRFRECQRVAVNQNQVTQVIRTDERDCNQGGGRN